MKCPTCGKELTILSSEEKSYDYENEDEETITVNFDETTCTNEQCKDLGILRYMKTPEEEEAEEEEEEETEEDTSEDEEEDEPKPKKKKKGWFG